MGTRRTSAKAQRGRSDAFALAGVGTPPLDDAGGFRRTAFGELCGRVASVHIDRNVCDLHRRTSAEGYVVWLCFGGRVLLLLTHADRVLAPLFRPVRDSWHVGKYQCVSIIDDFC